MNRLLTHFTLGLTLLGLVALPLSPAMAKEFQKVNWESLELSDDQRLRLTELDHQWHQTAEEAVPRIQRNQQRLRQLMASPNPSEEDVLAIQQRIHQDKLNLKMQATQIFLMKRKVLTPPQQAKLRKMLTLQ